ncbi:MAG TPA: hypothetical protein DEH78_28760 [Solibacterales bacterium]|nr:hypothetical protein [Bryobacterales bacterium]
MEIIGDRKFVEIPGSDTHELPPLLVRASAEVNRLDKVMNLANELVDAEDMIPGLPIDDIADPASVERRKMDLAVNLVEQYLQFVTAWQWGDGILEWIRQCETTFEFTARLRNLLRPDVWPHAGRSSFVTLLTDKAVSASGLPLERAVGMRLTFRQPPPISCFSNQFLFYLNLPVAQSAYETWAHMSPPNFSLPPERFSFQVVKM